MNFYDGPFPAGVPNPFTIGLHPYPSRFRGPLYARPAFGLEFLDRPTDFTVESGTEGLGAADVVWPRKDEDCDTTYPPPAVVTDGASFAAYVQNKACHEHVSSTKSARRWLVGLGAAALVGLVLGRATR